MHNKDRAAWRRYRARVLPELLALQGGACAICGGPIDPQADGRGPDGASLDHVHPLHDGGELMPVDMGMVRVTHTSCNSSRGARTRSRSVKFGALRDSPTHQRERKEKSQRVNESRLRFENGGEQIGNDKQSAVDFLSGAVTPKSSRLPKPPENPGEVVEAPEGMRLPRIWTQTPPDVTGSYGDQCLTWASENLGIDCRPWQRWAITRALEHRADGSLRWSVVVLTVSRQSGKSWVGKAVCGWRMAEGADLFGQPQMVVSTANKFNTASELWQGAAFPLQGHPKARMKWGRGVEEIRMMDTGSRWVVHAATPNLAVGLSVSMGFVDEAWSVDRECVESALVPTMLEQSSPQLWIVSTSGDSSSDLLENFREAAIRQLDRPEEADVLILEWSADPSALVTDRDGWRAASPHWSERREKYIEQQLELLPEAVFRTQILNQKVDALGGWCTRSQWAECEAPGLELSSAAGAGRLIAACEFSEDGKLYGLGVSQKVGERIVFRTFTFRTIDELWRAVTALPRSALLLVSVGFKGRVPLAPCETRPVGVNETRLATRFAHRAITDRTIAHNGDKELASHVLSAVVAYTGDTGPVISQRRSPGPITLARIMTWCVGAHLEINEKPAPRVISAA